MGQNAKDAVIEIIRQLPDDVTLADIIDKLYFRHQVDEGLQQLDNGEGLENDDVERRLAKWL